MGDVPVRGDGDLQSRRALPIGHRDPDFPDPAAEAAWLESTLGGRVDLLDDVAHYPQHQAPEVVVPAVLEFLAGLPATER